MDEAAWLTCRDPDPMLEFLHGRISERKLLLWGCACCELIRGLYPTVDYSLAVDTAERAADGLAEAAELQQHHQQVVDEFLGCEGSIPPAVYAIQARVLEAVAALTSSERQHREYALWFNVALALEGRRLEELHGKDAGPILVQWLDETSTFSHDTPHFLRYADTDP